MKWNEVSGVFAILKVVILINVEGRRRRGISKKTRKNFIKINMKTDGVCKAILLGVDLGLGCPTPNSWEKWRSCNKKKIFNLLVVIQMEH